MHTGSAQFSDLYDLHEDIGVGSYSICKRCVHRVSSTDYAAKVTEGNHAGTLDEEGRGRVELKHGCRHGNVDLFAQSNQWIKGSCLSVV
jgi:hypothetical protein